MAIPKHYAPTEIEARWRQVWEQQRFFESQPDARTPYSVVIPPPNVTGILHMGHMLNNTLQDVLVRRARMQGYNACWVPGTDHASIATEAKVTALLREQGIDKREIGREAFLEHAWAWKDQYGGTIQKQLKRLGASCDWTRERFTMESDLSAQVIKMFVKLYHDGLIYKGTRLINWDPEALTAVSDEEVNYKDQQSQLVYVRYELAESEDQLIIATTRPETILGDTAICVHPEDERYYHLIGKQAIVPVAGRFIPIIADEYVDPEFGTGALKVTPAHDPNDHALGQKHALETIDIFRPNAILNEHGGPYAGQDRFTARKNIVADLEAAGKIEKIETIQNSIGHSERTDAVIEPRLSEQWFVKMDALAPPALRAVMDGHIRFLPEKFQNVYRHWMENIRDWNISRQLWWGHRIPAWYLPDGQMIVAESKAEALSEAVVLTQNEKLKPSDLTQDEDVLDTWFSSWLWPISVFNGVTEPDNREINYYYPTKTLVTGPDIIFFWVARMIMAGEWLRGARPFEEVYFTGLVRDAQGRKMSKSLGNSPDTERLMDDYGVDGVRYGIMLASPAGNDLLFDEALCEQGRNFCNKMWNAMRLIASWEEQERLEERVPNATEAEAAAWLGEHLKRESGAINELIDQYRISDAQMRCFRLIRDDFCSWYLEMIKPGGGETLSRSAYNEAIGFYQTLVKLLHPFMPYITEELWHLLDSSRDEKDCVTVAEYPQAEAYDEAHLEACDKALQLIVKLRGLRAQFNLPPKDELSVHLRTADGAIYERFAPIIEKLAGVESIQFTQEKPDGASMLLIKQDEIFVPLADKIDVKAEIGKVEQELKRTQGFLQGVMKKLNNEKFIQNAKPELVERERNKKADAEARLSALEHNLADLKRIEAG